MSRPLPNGPRMPVRGVRGQFFVYTLRAPESGEIQYVGVTESPRLRWLLHVHNARRDAKRGVVGAVGRWLLSLDAEGKRPVMEIVERLRPGADRRHAERRERMWIRRHIRLGSPLLNVVDGGAARVPVHCGKCGGVGHRSATCGRRKPEPRVPRVRSSVPVLVRVVGHRGITPARLAVMAIRSARASGAAR